MKKTKAVISVLICMITILCIFPTFAEAAEPDAFRLNITIDRNAKPGEIVNLICSVDDIVPSSGLCGVSFTLTYDTAILEPVVVSENVEDTSPYNAFMTTVPMYTISAGDTEVQTPAYENITRCHPDKGEYNFVFVDMINYPGIKQGTNVDSTLRENGDLTLTIPFTVKEGTASGSKAVIGIKKAVGTTAGNEIKSVYTSDRSVIMHFTENGAEIITTAPEEPSVTGSVSGSGTAAATGTNGDGGSKASEMVTGASEKAAEKESSSSAFMIILAVISILAVGAVIFIYLKKKNK